MGIMVPETCWGNKTEKTAYFVAASRFFTFTMSTMHGHMNIYIYIYIYTVATDGQFLSFIFGVTVRNEMEY
jgi:hypothetical protein